MEEKQCVIESFVCLIFHSFVLYTYLFVVNLLHEN